MTKPNLTAEAVRAILDYDPGTGAWTWKERLGGPRSWNTKWAGKAAGCKKVGHGYLAIRIGRRLYYAHRLAFLYMTGKWPANEIDHRNLDRGDNRWMNLREATRSQNVMNGSLRTDNRSGFKGVYLNKHGNKWEFKLQAAGRVISKYGFESAEGANDARQKLINEFHGEFARAK